MCGWLVLFFFGVSIINLSGKEYQQFKKNKSFNYVSVDPGPQCINDTITVFNDLSGDTLLVLTNDILSSAGPFLASIILSPKHGIASVTGNNNIFYYPFPGYSGYDTVKYRLCDTDLGLCDDGLVILTVDAPNIPPKAVDDYSETVSNQKITINAINNDLSVDGDSIFINVISESNSGKTKNNNNGTITYTPDISIIGNDTVIYRLCDNGIPVYCSEGKIIITIHPPGEPRLVIPNAFSPNGDEVNDCFVIEGITDYPTKLIILNRWGNVVFSMDNYDNSWDGSYSRASVKSKLNREKLPEGTYYYILTYSQLNIARKGFILLSR